jgi:hypothetical protein
MKRQIIQEYNTNLPDLDFWYKKICKPEFIALDPVKFPHRYTKHEDIDHQLCKKNVFPDGKKPF